MTGAILKLQYSRPNEREVSANIAGGFYFVNEETIATCHHVLSKINLQPAPPYKHSQVFLLFKTGQYEITNEKMHEFPDTDTTLVQLKNKLRVPIVEIAVDEKKYTPGLQIECRSYFGVRHTHVKTDWKDNRLVVTAHRIEEQQSEFQKGSVIENDTLDYRSMGETVGVRYKNARAIRLSFGTAEGGSGCAVFLRGTNIIIGMITGGPADEKHPERTMYSYAIAAFQVHRAMQKSGIIKQWWKWW